jgi:hypothetical protein
MSEDTTRPSNRRLGIECAHNIADAFSRVPEDVLKWVLSLPDNPPGFAWALDWVEVNTPNALPAMKILRRHFVINSWAAKAPKGEKPKLEFRVYEGALDNAWQYAVSYAERFGRQDPREANNPMALATKEEAAKAFAFMRAAISRAVAPSSADRAGPLEKSP